MSSSGVQLKRNNVTVATDRVQKSVTKAQALNTKKTTPKVRNPSTRYETVEAALKNVDPYLRMTASWLPEILYYDPIKQRYKVKAIPWDYDRGQTSFYVGKGKGSNGPIWITTPHPQDPNIHIPRQWTNSAWSAAARKYPVENTKYNNYVNQQKQLLKAFERESDPAMKKNMGSQIYQAYISASSGWPNLHLLQEGRWKLKYVQKPQKKKAQKNPAYLIERSQSIANYIEDSRKKALDMYKQHLNFAAEMFFKAITAREHAQFLYRMENGSVKFVNFQLKLIPASVTTTLYDKVVAEYLKEFQNLQKIQNWDQPISSVDEVEPRVQTMSKGLIRAQFTSKTQPANTPSSSVSSQGSAMSLPGTSASSAPAPPPLQFSNPPPPSTGNAGPPPQPILGAPPPQQTLTPTLVPSSTPTSSATPVSLTASLPGINIVNLPAPKLSRSQFKSTAPVIRSSVKSAQTTASDLLEKKRKEAEARARSSGIASKRTTTTTSQSTSLGAGILNFLTSSSSPSTPTTPTPYTPGLSAVSTGEPDMEIEITDEELDELDDQQLQFIANMEEWNGIPLTEKTIERITNKFNERQMIE